MWRNAFSDISCKIQFFCKMAKCTTLYVDWIYQKNFIYCSWFFCNNTISGATSLKTLRKESLDAWKLIPEAGLNNKWQPNRYYEPLGLNLPSVFFPQTHRYLILFLICSRILWWDELKVLPWFLQVLFCTTKYRCEEKIG